MKNSLTSYGLLICFVICSATAYGALPGRQLQNLLKSIHTMQGSFTQTIYTGRGKVLRSSQGTMALQRPGQFRWSVIKPSTQLMVANGKLLWIYDKSLSQATVQSVKRGIGRTPAMILTGSARALTNYFKVRYYRGWYLLRPRYSGTLFKLVKLRFNGQQLRQMWLFDKLGQRSHLVFANIRINRRLSPSLFRFRPPRGVDVIRQK